MWKKNTTSRNSYTVWFSKLSYRHTEFALIAFAAGVFFIFLLAAHFTRPYGSDDVALQGVLHSWSHDKQFSAIVGTDNFILKLPLYALLSWFFSASRLQLFLTVLACNAILFVGAIYLLRYMGKTLTNGSKHLLAILFIPLLTFLSLSATMHGLSVPAQINTAYLNPNYRNAEVGLLFVAIVWLSMYLSSKSVHKLGRLHYLRIFGSTLGLSVFFYNDPFFIYTFGLGALASSIYLWCRQSISHRKLLTTLFIFSCATAISLVLRQALSRFGFIAADNIPRQFIATSELVANFQNTIGSIFINFNANIWGQVLENKWVLLSLLNTLLLLVSLLALINAAKNVKHHTELRIPELVLAATCCTTLAVFFLTKSGSYLDNFRYLFPFSWCVVILACPFLVRTWQAQSLKRYAALIIPVLCLCLAVNVSINMTVAARGITNQSISPNISSEKAVGLLRSEQLVKGYSGYWDANITSYFSGYRISVLPLACVNGRFMQYHWLVNTKLFNTNEQRTFVIQNTLSDASGWSSCDLRQLGVPKKVTKATDMTIYTYDFDIGKNLPIYTQ